MTTPQNPFATPDAGGEFFSPNKHPEWKDRLLIVRPNVLKSQDFNDGTGPKDMVEAYVMFVDLADPMNPQRPLILENAVISGAGLVPQIKNKIGQMVLGRLQQKAPQGQKSGAYFLADPTEQDNASAAQAIQVFPVPEFKPFVAPVAQAVPAWNGAQPAQPQGMAAQLPYDPWQSTPGAQPAQPQAPSAWTPQGQAPAAPVQPAAQGWAPQVAQPPMAPQAPSYGSLAPAGQNPALVALLQSKGINVTPDMNNETMQMIANSFNQ